MSCQMMVAMTGATIRGKTNRTFKALEKKLSFLQMRSAIPNPSRISETVVTKAYLTVTQTACQNAGSLNISPQLARPVKRTVGRLKERFVRE